MFICLLKSSKKQEEIGFSKFISKIKEEGANKYYFANFNQSSSNLLP